MDDRVQEVCDLLVAAWHRHGQPLAHGQVERVVASRHLAPDERVDVYARLARLGIVCDTAAVRAARGADGRGGAAQTGETPAADGPGGARWPSGAPRRLRFDEEIALGRHMAVARRVRAQVDAARRQATPAVQAILEQGARAREHMITANLPLVVTIAQSFRHRSTLEWADLVQEGTVGLLRAVEKFDYTQGWRFSTYAAWWIRHSIRCAVTDTATPLRLPARTAHDVHRFKRAWRRLSHQAPEQAPTLPELAAALAWAPEKTLFIADIAQATMLSLEAGGGADRRPPLRDVLAAPEPGPEALALHAETLACVAAGLHSLSARHQDIVWLRFGFATGEAWTLAQIGAKWGLSAERIRQLQNKALAHLRQHLGAPRLAGREASVPGDGQSTEGRARQGKRRRRGNPHATDVRGTGPPPRSS